MGFRTRADPIETDHMLLTEVGVTDFLPSRAPSAGGSGEISYVMEREDDFDEEDDPDDDLDF